MSLPRARVRDDRGRWGRLGPVRRRRMRPGEAVMFSVWLLAAAVPSAAGCVAIAIWLGVDRGSPVVSAAVVSAAAIVGAAGGFAVHTRFFWPRFGVRMFLRESECPCCEYRLAGLAPEADGCTVCPECGGAWRLADETA